MVWHGMGSMSSPIVISDDEDDAYVESQLQLEDRLSDSWDNEQDAGRDLYDEQYNWSSRELFQEPTREEAPEYAPEAVEDFNHTETLKRKRTPSVEELSFPPSQVARVDPEPSRPRSRTRRSQKGRSRKVAEAQSRTIANTSRSQQQRVPQQNEPPRNHSSSRLPPPSSVRQDLTANSSKSVSFGHEPPPHPPRMPSPPPSSFPPLYSSSIPLPAINPLMDFHAPPFDPLSLATPMHVPPMPPPASLPPRPPPTITPLPPQPQRKKLIGKPPDLNPENKRPTFPALDKSAPPPDPSRTLVLTLLPKKFRTSIFALNWAMSFDKSPEPKRLPRIEVDTRLSKTLIEFKTPEIARAAWSSPQLPPGEGREQIQAWWYRELEEGEIGEEAEAVQAPPPPKKGRLRTKRPVLKPFAVGPLKISYAESKLSEQFRTSAHAPRVPAAHPIAGPSQSQSTSTSLAAQDLRVDTGTDKFAAPLVSASSTTFSMTSEESMDLGSEDGFVSDTERHIRGPPLQWTPGVKERSKVSATSDTSSTTLVSDVSMVSQTSETSTAVSSPTLVSTPAVQPVSVPTEVPLVAPTPDAHPSLPLPVPTEDNLKVLKPPVPVDPKQALSTRQRELEAKIAQSKKEIAERAAQSRAQTPQVMPPPAVPSVKEPIAATLLAEPTSTMPSEVDLRKMVLESKNRRLAAAATAHAGLPPEPSAKPVTPPVTTTTETAKTMVNLEDLAVSFISETIQAATATGPLKPLPPRPVRRLSEKEMLNEKQKALERHIAQTKALMDKLQTARTKEKRDAIMHELRESSRTMDETMEKFDQLQQTSVDAKSAESTRPSSAHWPETPSEFLVLTISDDEDEDEDMDTDL